MDKQVTKEQIGSIVSLLVAGKVPYDEVQSFIGKYKNVPSKKKRKEPVLSYRMPVTYSKLLEAKRFDVHFWGKDDIFANFNAHSWERHNSCISIDESPGNREFLIAKMPVEFFGQQINSVRDALAAHVDREGYRFAIEIEADEFQKIHVACQDYTWIYALGSTAFERDYLDGSTALKGEPYVRVLSVRDGRPLRGVYKARTVIEERDYLLLVRKVA